MVKKILLPLFVAVLLVMLDASCHKEPVQPEEGIYLGVIGFNDQLYVKDISLLNSSTYSKFRDFIYFLTPGDGTALYYADYTALQKMKAFSKPPKLKNVALVTFTDGLDNISTANSEYDPEGYGSTTAYREALHNMIKNDKIHGLHVSAYSIGLKGGDVTDEAQFMETLRKLSSSDDKVFQVTNMNEALQRFSEIASSLYSISTSVNLGVNVPGGYDEGQRLRFTFDNVNAAAQSSLYIEATYRRPSSSSRKLDNISYHGFAQGPTTIDFSSSQGVYYQFLFENLTYADSSPVPQSDMGNIKLWKQTSTGAWDKETEFHPGSSTTVTEDKNSALIILVLDCTTSLGSDFAEMQNSAKQFVKTLANGDAGSGGSTPTQPTVTTSPATALTSTSATLNGTISNPDNVAITAQGFQWKTTQGGTYTTVNATGTNMTYNLNGLTANTSYTYRAYITAENETSYGAEVTFTTTTASQDGQPCPNAATVSYDGFVYNTVVIGQQCWMKQNLRAIHYADGTSISLGNSASNTTAYYYYPSNSSSNVSTYGLLYNWKAVMRNSSSSAANPSGVQGICPNGWHVPSDAEWTELESYVSGQSQYCCSGNTSNIAKALAATSGWNTSSSTCAVGNGQSSNNATGFGALPAGGYNSNGYHSSGYYALFWSATEVSSGYAWGRYLGYNGAYVTRGSDGKNYGFSVRCLRD